MDIMKQRWQQTDKELDKLLKKIKTHSRKLKDNLQDIFNNYKYTYSELFMYASQSEIDRFNRIIGEYELTGYNGLKIKNLKGKKKVKRMQIIEALILIEECKMQFKIQEDLAETLKSIVSISYEQALKETGTKKKIKLADGFLYDTLLTFMYQGALWNDYIEGLSSYYAGQLYKEYINEIQANKEPNTDNEAFTKLINKQNNAMLHRKETWYGDTPLYMDKYVGSIDALATYIANKTVLKGYINAGVKEVVFVAEYDNKTTNMCKSLDGQVFKIDEWNDYTRYSAIDGKEVRYRTEGLEVGINLPPITNHFHWCRSTIIPKEIAKM